jgi:hypothetical protein
MVKLTKENFSFISVSRIEGNYIESSLNYGLQYVDKHKQYTIYSTFAQIKNTVLTRKVFIVKGLAPHDPEVFQIFDGLANDTTYTKILEYLYNLPEQPLPEPITMTGNKSIIKLTDFVIESGITKRVAHEKDFHARKGTPVLENSCGYHLNHWLIIGHFDVYHSYRNITGRSKAFPTYYIKGLADANPEAYYMYNGNLTNLTRENIEIFLEELLSYSSSTQTREAKLLDNKSPKVITPKEYKLKNPILQPIIIETPMHFSNLLFQIGNIGVTIEEFESTIAHSIIQAKETNQPVLISYAGNYDLLITDNRIHVIQIYQTYDLPDIIEAE